MKSLNPAIREKKRYLLLEGKNLQANVEKAILDYVGVLGYSKAVPTWIKIGKEKGVLSINRASLNDVRTSLVLDKNKIRIKKVSGTLRGLGA